MRQKKREKSNIEVIITKQITISLNPNINNYIKHKYKIQRLLNRFLKDTIIYCIYETHFKYNDIDILKKIQFYANTNKGKLA